MTANPKLAASMIVILLSRRKICLNLAYNALGDNWILYYSHCTTNMNLIQIGEFLHHQAETIFIYADSQLRIKPLNVGDSFDRINEVRKAEKTFWII